VQNRDSFVNAILSALERFGLDRGDVLTATISQGSIVMAMVVKNRAAQAIIMNAALKGLVARVEEVFYQGFISKDAFPTARPPDGDVTSAGATSDAGLLPANQNGQAGGKSTSSTAADKSLVIGLAAGLAVLVVVVLFICIIWLRANARKNAAVAPAGKTPSAVQAQAQATAGAHMEEGLAKLTRAWHADRRLDPGVPPPALPSKRRGSAAWRSLPEKVLVQPAVAHSAV